MNRFLIPDNFVERADCKLESLDYVVPLSDLRVHDAPATNLPGTAANDDLGFVTGTIGTAAPSVQSGDGKATTIARYARFQFALPPEYVAGESVVLKMTAKTSTVSDTTSTLDAVIYEVSKAGAAGSDLCATAAQSINSATAAEKSYTVTATGLSPGDVLDVRIHVAIEDGATGTPVVATISDIRFTLGCRG